MHNIAEKFRIHEKDKDKIKPGMILAVDNEDPNYYVLAGKHNQCVVGVVSKDPIYCNGGDESEYTVPVALVGRVMVKCNLHRNNIPTIGDWMAIDTDYEDGYGVSVEDLCQHKGKIVGKIVKIINENYVMILVNLR